jgi:sec-independent protein translocase protein TatA
METFRFGKESAMFSMPTLGIILVIVLIIFGGGKLPEIGSAIGKGLKDFKKAVEDEPSKPDEKIESKPIIDDSSRTSRE